VYREILIIGRDLFDYDFTVSQDKLFLFVVIKTRFEGLEDAFVTVTIPELGVYAKGYLGDLAALEYCDDIVLSRFWVVGIN
jgi:hypothetical protein